MLLAATYAYVSAKLVRTSSEHQIQARISNKSMIEFNVTLKVSYI